MRLINLESCARVVSNRPGGELIRRRAASDKMHMNLLRTGHFFGETKRVIRLCGITLTDTDTDDNQSHVDWHRHENAYFTFILRGRIIEGNKKESYYCSAGSLLFHSLLEPHYNVKPEGHHTKCFHLEFEKGYFDEFALDVNALQGLFSIENADIKFLFYKLFRETESLDDMTPASVQMLLLEALGQLLHVKQIERQTRPLWAKKLKEILHDGYAETLSLKYLSNELNLHPVHLSRYFSKHFDCTYSEYVRKIRIEKSLSLLPDHKLSLTEIAFACGFADQSHFLRCFRQIIGISPSAYRKILAA